MSLQKAQTFAIEINPQSTKKLAKIILSNLDIEILNPKEFDDSLQNVVFFTPETEKYISKLNFIKSITKWINVKKSKKSYSLDKIWENAKQESIILDICKYIHEKIKKEQSSSAGDRDGKTTVEQESEIIKAISQDLDDGDIEKILQLETYYQLLLKIGEISPKIFFLSDKIQTGYLLIAISPSSLKNLSDICKKEQLKIHTFDLNKEIVVWKNNKTLEPFQKVVEALGFITSKDADPSWVVAFFFSVFFGFCLGDGVYGLILMLVCAFMLNSKKIKSGFKSILRMFLLCGGVTFIIGALTGSWLGDLFSTEKGKLLDTLGIGQNPISGFLSAFQVIDPISSVANLPLNQWLSSVAISPIVFMMGIAMFLGLINTFTAITLSLYGSFRRRDTSAIIFEASWAVFLISIIGLVFFSSFGGIFAVSLLTSTAGLFVFNDGSGIFGKILGGLGKFWELISFGADLVSFTRLIAVGLTGSIIANVVNLLATTAMNLITIPVLDITIAVVILIVGHLLNFAIALFGAYINPLRLHYVEFLPKFYKGEGRGMKTNTIEDLSVRVEI